MASRPPAPPPDDPDDGADGKAPSTDPAPDGTSTDDPIVEAIEEEGEPSGGNFA